MQGTQNSAITAPNVPARIRALRAALKQAMDRGEDNWAARIAQDLRAMTAVHGVHERAFSAPVTVRRAARVKSSRVQRVQACGYSW